MFLRAASAAGHRSILDDAAGAQTPILEVPWEMFEFGPAVPSVTVDPVKAAACKAIYTT